MKIVAAFKNVYRVFGLYELEKDLVSQKCNDINQM